MFEGWTVKKIYSLSGIVLLVAYATIILTVDIIRPRDIASLEPFIAVICLIISWMPLLGLVLICLVYNVNLCSSKYTSVRRRCYFGVFTYMFSLLFIFVPENVFTLLNFYVVNLILLLLGVINLLLHGSIGETLSTQGFSISHELQVLKRMNEKRSRQLQSLNYERKLLLFIIVYIIPYSEIVFTVGSIGIAILILRPLDRIVRYYNKMRKIIRINPRWIYFNHSLSISLSILLYVLCEESSLPAFICSFSSAYLVYEFRMRHIRYLYAILENKTK